MWEGRRLLLILGLMVAVSGTSWLLYSCTGASGAHDVTGSGTYLSRQENPINARNIDSVIHLLRNGDLALRTGADATSVMLRQMNLTNKTYSHCGIVMIENGYPFVY